MESSSRRCGTARGWLKNKSHLWVKIQDFDISACKRSCFHSFCFGSTITSDSNFPNQVPALCVTPMCLTQAGTTEAGIGCFYCSAHSDASKITPWQGQIEPARHSMKSIFCRVYAKHQLKFAQGTEQVLLHGKKTLNILKPSSFTKFCFQLPDK